METLSANVSGKVRRAKLYGRDYIVAPLSMLVPGVLNGSQGALFYPPDEVARSADIWNGTPITLNHPSVNGMPVSARSPDVLNRVGLGFVFGSVFESKLSAEGWFDIEQTRRVDNRVLTALEKNQPIELSTGLYTHNEQAPAEANHNGTPYTHVARNYRADHLAVLPDSVGACSLRDGCGVLVNQTCPVCGRSPAPTENADKPSHFKVCDRDDKGHCMPGKGPTKDTPSKGGTMTCQCPDGTTTVKEKLPDEDSGNAGGSRIAVKNESETQPTPVEITMKDQLVSYLTTNCSCWKGKGETLNKLDEPELAAMKADHEATVANAALVTNLRTELETVKATAKAIANAGPRLTPDEQETLAWANTERTRQKALLVERLLVNVSDPAKRQAKGQALMSKPQAELQELIELLPTVNSTSAAATVFDFSRPIPNYAGAAGGPAVNHAHGYEDDDPNDFPPTVNETYPDPRDAWRQRHSA